MKKITAQISDVAWNDIMDTYNHIFSDNNRLIRLLKEIKIEILLITVKKHLIIG